MSNRDFAALLAARQADGFRLCIGLDPVVEKIQMGDKKIEEAVSRFCISIVMATYRVAGAYKPNTAFFEALGDEGTAVLERLIWYIQKTAPGVPIILDAKRGDIGNTNEGSAAFAFDYCGADAITVSPYLGEEALRPFLDREGKGVIVLGKTSNPGSNEFQNLGVSVDGVEMPLYEYVALRVGQKWQTRGTLGLVAGATYPGELEAIARLAPTTLLLIPGVGKQGGSVTEVAAALRRAGHTGPVLVNVSSGIIYADNPGTAAQQYHEELAAAFAA